MPNTYSFGRSRRPWLLWHPNFLRVLSSSAAARTWQKIVRRQTFYKKAVYA